MLLCSYTALGKLFNFSGPLLAIIVSTIMLFLPSRAIISEEKDELLLKQKQSVCVLPYWMEFTRTSISQAGVVKVDFIQERAFEWGYEGQALDGPGKERYTK